MRPDVLEDGGGDVLPIRAEEIAWLVTEGIPWVFRRSRDLLPLLLTVTLRPAGLPVVPGRAARP